MISRSASLLGDARLLVEPPPVHGVAVTAAPGDDLDLSKDLLARWAAETPHGFTFVLKASRRITHEKRLSADAADSVSYLFETAKALAPKARALSSSSSRPS